MEIIKDNTTRRGAAATERENRTYKHTCFNCGSEFRYDYGDTYEGAYGARYVQCPCCGSEAICDEIPMQNLTAVTAKFPLHYSHTFSGGKGCVHVDDERIQKYVKEAIESMRNARDPDDNIRMTTTGDAAIIVSKLDGDEEYSVFVSHDFYETFIPFEYEDYFWRKERRQGCWY